MAFALIPSGMMSDKTSKGILLRAIVQSNQDPEKLGRLKVTYPWFGENSSDITSDWAQVSMPYGSEGQGQWFLPEVDDEVLVALESSNLSNPIILGTLYSSKRKPPSVGKPGDFNQDGKNSLRFIKTKAGNALVLEDASGKEEVQLKQTDGSQLTLKKEDVVLKESGGAQLHLAGGKVALGNSSAELLDLISQLLDVISQNSSTMVSTAMGPGVLNPSITSKITEVKQKLDQIKGKI